MRMKSSMRYRYSQTIIVGVALEVMVEDDRNEFFSVSASESLARLRNPIFGTSKLVYQAKELFRAWRNTRTLRPIIID